MDQQVGKLIEPPPVPFSFEQPGWYVLGGLLVLLLALITWLLVKYYRKNRYRKHALQFLNNTEQTLSQVKEFDLLVYQAQMLIKQIAMARYGRHHVSGLRGDQWIAFINNTWREKSFDNSDVVLLNQNIYASEKSVSADEATNFTNKARRWIKKHKRKYAV
ncbi:DUF4381 domain-containing protein [Mucilaginibacter sp. X4EP1]|uniref:DUF4381 domain-containing protein n=1 Tax=Mucilaginibacter sp. X4EP1 TaxID=2723092 RepID=UPI00216A1F8D|nr:DUF4381 domain-containing protein [Mucilaginibacter sp. X4EP1]MCS3813579.1 hypothetical protein [Mucilaginibacter sp. X4EP1]